jgi:mono/diheme cytochrome c family protein/small nuclear ribonucleoprotein (snRNP)-like protein
VNHSNFYRLLGMFVLSACITAFAAQQQQPAPQNPPPEPPPGAANGPHPGPAADKKAGPGQRTGGAGQQAAPGENQMQEAMRKFLAIGAPPDPQAVKRGQALFVSTCGFCHGTNANGGETGPDLVRSVLVLHDQGTGKEIGPVIHNGRPGKGMPSFTNLSDAQIKDIAAFLLSRSQAAANRGGYQIQNIVTGDPKQGEAYFTAHCASCHSATGDLAHVAAKYDPVALQSRFLYPRTEHWPGMPGPPPNPRAQKTVTVTLPSGQTYSGKLERVDDFSVALTEPSGEYHSWLFDAEKGMNVQVHDPLKEHAELLRQYTNADMHNILAYLETMK